MTSVFADAASRSVPRLTLAAGTDASFTLGSSWTAPRWTAPEWTRRRLSGARATLVKTVVIAAAVTAILAGVVTVTHVPTATSTTSSAADFAPAASTVPTMTATQFTTAFAGDLSAAATTLGAMSATQVATLWTEFTPGYRALLMTGFPAIIGNLEGVAYTDRATANVSRLAGLLADTEATYRSMTTGADQVDGETASSALATTLSRLEAIKLLVERYSPTAAATRLQPEYLVSLQAAGSGPPRVAVAVGDVDVATYVTVLVPGMNSSALELDDYLRGAKRIQTASPDSAVILWIGAHSPSALEVPSNDRAIEGAPLLAAVLAGYDAFRTARGLASQLSVVAHSYGTATASLALASADYHVDNFVMLGSAGIPTTVSIDDLHVPVSRVYASQASADTLAGLGQVLSGRANPAVSSWGATVFGSDGLTLGDGERLGAVNGHNAVGSDNSDDKGKYLGPATESLYAIQRIVTGKSYAVPDITSPTAARPSAAGVASDVTASSPSATAAALVSTP
ncbi:alpha/beta hydrolase family protein [Plantibacter flavus]|uniref:alpha/beta hydrolase n=1 Tax=Plantibacter flavus TaxID=150123 RepID=UPI003F17EFBE